MAVVCGLGAMYGTTKLISRGKAAPVVETQDVLVAVQDFKVEEVLKPDTVKVVRMPKAAVPAGAFSSAKDVEDRWVQIGILEGEPIIDRKLAPRGARRAWSRGSPRGCGRSPSRSTSSPASRASCSPTTGSTSSRSRPGATASPEAETVLQDVLVLASGQVFTRPDDRSIQSRTVTLAVTPEQVDTLVSAKSRGTLTLALRGLNDHTVAASRKKQPPEKEKEKERRAEAPEPKPVEVVKAPEPKARRGRQGPRASSCRRPPRPPRFVHDLPGRRQHAAGPGRPAPRPLRRRVHRPGRGHAPAKLNEIVMRGRADHARPPLPSLSTSLRPHRPPLLRRDAMLDNTP